MKATSLVSSKKSELAKVVIDKNVEIEELQKEIKEIQKQIEEEKVNAEEIRPQLSEKYNAKLQAQETLQTMYEVNTLTKLEQEKNEEMRKVQHRIDLDLEYAKYKLKVHS